MADLKARLIKLAIRAGYHSKPSFLIVGAQKAGTTALYYYLGEHPQIVASREKEVGFFVPELYADWPEHPHHAVLYSGDGTVFDDRRAYRRALAWYHGHFPLPHRLGRGRLTFEATPDYLYYPRAAERLFRYDSNLRLVVLLRDPVARAFSAWTMRRRWGDYRPLIYAPKREEREFESAIAEEIDEIRSGEARVAEPGYVQRGLYYEQLVRYFAWFDRRQLLVLDSAELEGSTSATVGRVVDFLALPAYPHRHEWPRFFVGEYDSGMPGTGADMLRDFYRPHTERLYELLGRDFGWH
jgi:hypothetical protein